MHTYSIILMYVCMYTCMSWPTVRTWIVTMVTGMSVLGGVGIGLDTLSSGAHEISVD